MITSDDGLNGKKRSAFLTFENNFYQSFKHFYLFGECVYYNHKRFHNHKKMMDHRHQSFTIYYDYVDHINPYDYVLGVPTET